MERVDNPASSGWQYNGRNARGEVKFKRYTHQSIEHVKQYLDALGIYYRVCDTTRIVFIYRDREPVSVYSSHYCYYYTTGRWAGVKNNKHYHSDSIEHFMQKYYRTSGRQEEREKRVKQMKGKTDES